MSYHAFTVAVFVCHVAYFLYANCTFIILIFPLAVSEAHQKVGGTEDPESGTSDLHLWREDTRSQDKSESRKEIGNCI